MGGISPADVRLMVAKAGRLTQDWTAAEATLPRDWRLMGVVRGPREVDPAIHSESWVAWARGLGAWPGR